MDRVSLAPARANPEKLRLVLFNLIQNAIRHIPADGSVTLAAESDADRVEVEVAGMGTGIDAGDRAFEAFFRGGDGSARSGESTGPRTDDLPRDRRGPRRGDLVRRLLAGSQRALQPAPRRVGARRPRISPCSVLA